MIILIITSHFFIHKQQTITKNNFNIFHSLPCSHQTPCHCYRSPAPAAGHSCCTCCSRSWRQLETDRSRGHRTVCRPPWQWSASRRWWRCWDSWDTCPDTSPPSLDTACSHLPLQQQRTSPQSVSSRCCCCWCRCCDQDTRWCHWSSSWLSSLQQCCTPW